MRLQAGPAIQPVVGLPSGAAGRHSWHQGGSWEPGAAGAGINALRLPAAALPFWLDLLSGNGWLLQEFDLILLNYSFSFNRARLIASVSSRFASFSLL
jgi:hypothetical protein